MRVPTFKLFPHQREALKFIESWAARPVHDVVAVVPLSRFKTSRLAAKLMSALHGKTA